MVSIKIQNFRDEVDPYIVSFALPGIVDARCYNALTYPNFVGFPEAWDSNDWSINLVMAKGTDRTKLAPIITLAPGATITSKHADVQDFSQMVEYTVICEDGSTARNFMFF